MLRALRQNVGDTHAEPHLSLRERLPLTTRIGSEQCFQDFSGLITTGRTLCRSGVCKIAFPATSYLEGTCSIILTTTHVRCKGLASQNLKVVGITICNSDMKSHLSRIRVGAAIVIDFIARRAESERGCALDMHA